MLSLVFNAVKTKKLLFFLAIFFAVLEGIFNAISISTLIPLLEQVNQNISNELDWPFSIIPSDLVSNFGYLFIFLGAALVLKIIFATLSLAIAGLIRLQLWREWSSKIVIDQMSVANESIGKKKFNDGRLINLITREVNQATSLVSGYIAFLTQIFSFVLIIIAMLLVNLQIAIIGFLVCAFIYFTLFNYINNILKNRGVRGIKYSKGTASYIAEVIKGRNDLKFLNSQGFVINKLNSMVSNLTKNNFIMTIIQLVPKYFIEILLGSSLFIYGFYMASKNLQTLEESIQISEIVFFLVGFQRIAATASSISTLVAKNYKRLPSLKLVNTFIHKKINTNISDHICITNPKVNDGEKLIRMENISFKVDKIFILNNISFEIKQNSLTFIYGESGSGKSTLAKIISGNLTPTSGSIFYSNNQALSDQKSIIGYIPQEPQLFSGTIKENIYLNIDIDNSNLEHLDNVLEASGLNKILNDLSEGIDTMIDSSSESLSVGQKCRIAIARLLIRKPALIIFDESLDRLELKSAESVLLNIKEKTNASIIVITHREINTALPSNQFRVENGKILKV